jgi:flagellar biosynthetic protein FliR
MLARLMISALEVGGMVVAHQMGLANAFALNPSMATQGSIPGAVLGMAGVMLIFATDMHHLLLRSLVQTYALFPAGSPPPVGDMAQTITRFAANSFLVGAELAAPFVVVGLVLFTGIGLLGRLMPQIQFFMIMTPLQIGLGLLLFAATLSGVMLFWLGSFESNLIGFLGNG